MIDIEREIIKSFIIDNKQERLLWELSSPRKRDAVIWKFADASLFKSNCLSPTNYMSAECLEKILFKKSRTSFVYFIGEDYIGQIPLKEATQRTQAGEICIIYCGKGIGYYQGEEISGKPPRFFLNKN